MMTCRCLSLLALLSVACVSSAQPIAPPAGSALVAPDDDGRRGVTGWPIYAPNGWYSPYPGIWNPVPYPGNTYPPHWIWNYMTFDEPVRHGLVRRGYDDDTVGGRALRGRDNLYPAVPYSDYLKDQRGLLKSTEPARPAPTATQALIEVRMPRENAKLFFDGKEAPGEGATRTFLTPPLTPGANYTFTVRATWLGPIDDLSNEVNVTFQAGQRKDIDLRPKN